MVFQKIVPDVNSANFWNVPVYTTVKVSRNYIALVAKSQTTILKLSELECVDVLQDVQSVEFVDDCTGDTLMYL